MSNKKNVEAYNTGIKIINQEWETIVKDPKKNLYDKYSKPNEKKRRSCNGWNCLS